MTTFGDIIEYEFEKYVYLADINNSCYLAKIISGELAREITKERQKLEDRSIKGSIPAQQKLNASLSFCFVVLTTEVFKDCIAYCKPPAIDSKEFDYTPESNKLNKKDLSAIKNEIINGNYPGGLKEFIKTIEISD